MKTASIRELRHDLNRVLAWVGNGEEVAITKHRRTVARLLPVQKPKTARPPMPDIASRLQKVFRRKVIADQTLGAILKASRGNY